MRQPAEAGSIGSTMPIVWEEETAVCMRDRARIEHTAFRVDGSSGPPGAEGVGMFLFCPLVCVFCPLVHVFVRWCVYICRWRYSTREIS
jgi:hypothetical protein